MLLIQGSEVISTQVELEKNDKGHVVLGKGSFGTVFLGTLNLQLKNGREKKISVAVKRVQLSKNKFDRIHQIESIKRELAIYKSVKLENIVQFYGDNLNGELKIENCQQVDLYLEKCDGSLSQLFKNYQNKATENLEIKALDCIRIIVDTLIILKKAEIQRSGKIYNGIFHRDLNLNNVLYTKKKSGRIVLKISDFGISRFIDRGFLTLFSGTLNTMSPENANHQPYDPEKNDAWSLGVMLFQMLFGEDSYLEGNFLMVNEKKLQQSINQQHLKITQDTTNLLLNLLNPKEKDRWDFDQILECEAFIKLDRRSSNCKMGLLPYILNNRLKDFQNLKNLFIRCPYFIEKMPNTFKKYVLILFKVWGERQCKRFSGVYEEKIFNIGDCIQKIQKQLSECDKLIEMENKILIDNFKCPYPDDFWYYMNKIEQIQATIKLPISEKEYLLENLENKLKLTQNPLQNQVKEKLRQEKQNNLGMKIEKLKEEIHDLEHQAQIEEVEQLRTLFQSFFYNTQGKRLYKERNDGY